MSDATTNGASFKDGAHQQLTDLKAAVDRTQAWIQAANAKVLTNPKAKRDEATAGLEARRTDIAEANARMKERVEAKKAETDTAVAAWKAKREVRKLEDRAEGADEAKSGGATQS